MIAGLGVGGAEHMLRRLILSSQGATDTEHRVVSLTTVGEVGAMLQRAGIVVEALGMRSGAAAPLGVGGVRRRIREFRPDVVQGWMYHGDLLGGLAARLEGQGRVLWGIRASEMVPGTPLTTRLTRWLCARLSSRLPDLIVCAAEAARRVHAAAGYDASKMLVIPNGFDVAAAAVAPGDARELRASLGWAGDELVVGTVGRFDPYKDYETFVRAAALVAAREPRARFLMVGRGLDAENAELAAWISRAGIAPRFALLGGRTDVARCLAAMDAFVLSSASEGFPNVVGEAMAAAVPCVVTDAGDAASLVGDTGTVVAPRDPAALAGGIARMLDLPSAERRGLGARARARIVAEFSLERARDRFEGVYRRVTGRPEAA